MQNRPARFSGLLWNRRFKQREEISMRWIRVTLMLLVIGMGCEQPGVPYQPPAPEVLQSVEEVERLTDIARLRLNRDGSATLMVKDQTGEGIDLMMYDGSGRVVNATTSDLRRSIMTRSGRWPFIT